MRCGLLRGKNDSHTLQRKLGSVVLQHELVIPNSERMQKCRAGVWELLSPKSLLRGGSNFGSIEVGFFGSYQQGEDLNLICYNGSGDCHPILLKRLGQYLIEGCKQMIWLQNRTERFFWEGWGGRGGAQAGETELGGERKWAQS